MTSEPILNSAIALRFNFGVSISDSLLVGALGVSAVFSVVVAVLAFVAYYRRRTMSYLLVAIAFSTFLGKTGTGFAYLTGQMSAGMHHSCEHLLDVVMMVLVLAAVYYARSSEERRFGST
jgi:hypothetical protein